MADTTTVKRPRGRPPKNASPANDDDGLVQALDRGLTLLNSLAKTGKASLTELSLSAGLPASSAHRLLATLSKHDYVTFDDQSQNWTIGLQAFRVGAAYAQRASLIDVSRSILRDLMTETGETANLGLMDTTEVVFVSQVETPHPIRAFFRIGSRGPIHASGIGKAILSQLPRTEVETILQQTGLPEFTDRTRTTPQALFDDLEAVAVRGWALDDEERYDGMRCIAAPIRNAQGELVAGVSVSGPVSRLEDNAVAEIGAKVRRAAGEIERALGLLPGSNR